MSGAFLDIQRLPWPAPWAKIFGRTAPLWLEIGFGSGQFLTWLAETNPEVNVAGIEISQPALRKAVRKREKHDLINLQLFYGRAEQFLWTLCSAGDVANVHINFPDPWPKKAHHGRRLVDQKFLRLLATRMRVDSRLEIATDDEAYAQAISSLLEESPHYCAANDEPFVTVAPGRPVTKYEERAVHQGRLCYYFAWQRNHVPVAGLFSVPREYAMPHIVLHCPLDLGEIRSRFVPESYSDEGYSLRFIELFESAERGTLLVDTYIEEEPLSQRLGLTIRARGGDEVIVGIHDIGFPRPTAGLHRAVSRLARWLQQLHPSVVVEESNLRKD